MTTRHTLAAIATVLLSCALPPPAQAALFIVNDPADVGDLLPGNGSCDTGVTNHCTLRAAIEEANALPGEDVINVPAGQFLLSQGVLEITDHLRVLGNQGAAPTIVDAQGASAVFLITGGRRRTRVELHHLHITNGLVPVGDGGGVFNFGGRLLIDHCSIHGNSAFTGGGGIQNGGGGILSLVRSEVFDNGVLEITQEGQASAAPQRGGGIQNSGILYVDKSTIAGNAAGRGGGIFQGIGGILIMRDSTVSDNTGTIDTGGIINGGIAFFNNVTIAFNEGLIDPFHDFLDTGAGGISGDEIFMANSIVAGNRYGPPPNGFGTNLDCAGTITGAGYNLIQDTTACTLAGSLTGYILGEDPLLGPLQSNGGVTRTHALPAGSPAVNAGNPAFPDGLLNHCGRTDQRFRLRGVGPGVGRCDMGAYERNAIPGQIGGLAP
jgi:hypothetical protein